MFFLIQVFLCYKVYSSSLWKNCLGDVATVFNPEKYFGDFSLEIIPGAPPHLPGERELVVERPSASTIPFAPVPEVPELASAGQGGLGHVGSVL